MSKPLVFSFAGQDVAFDVTMVAKHEQDWVAHGQWVIQHGRGVHGILRFAGLDPRLSPGATVTGRVTVVVKAVPSHVVFGRISAGENACVIIDGDDYVLFHSPANGIGVKRSRDLKDWRDQGLLTLGQNVWPWAQGRLTAGFVLDLRTEPAVGQALLFFHGSDFPENDPRGGFGLAASIYGEVPIANIEEICACFEEWCF